MDKKLYSKRKGKEKKCKHKIQNDGRGQDKD